MESKERYSKAIAAYQRANQKSRVSLSSYCRSHHIHIQGLKQWMEMRGITVNQLQSDASQKEEAPVSDFTTGSTIQDQFYPLSFQGSAGEGVRSKKKTRSFLKGVTITFPDGVIVSIKETGRRELSEFINLYNHH